MDCLVQENSFNPDILSCLGTVTTNQFGNKIKPYVTSEYTYVYFSPLFSLFLNNKIIQSSIVRN